MSFQYTKETVWSVELDDQPGAAAEKLSALAEAGADLQFVTAQRLPEKPGKGILIVSPLRGKQQVDAASRAGFSIASDLVGIKLEGLNKPGLGSRIAEAISEAGVNLQGITAVVAGKKFTSFIAFDNPPEAELGIRVLKNLKRAL